ncbi:MAG: cytochrome-c oxidase, cbb3-type subunit III [Kordiimonadaceae bacterium]|nr:cytochrome-c oxidase, cbb3-type subunit III [Kordiimonadaceae bacterium]
MTQETKENRETDDMTGTETTGHEWDGIKELDTPMPRWWLLTFYACIIWAVAYWYIYPAWPTFSGEGERGGTVGSTEWTQYKQLEESQAEIIARRAVHQNQFDEASFSDIKQNKALYSFGMAGGKAAFGDNCATCHGTGGAGASGYPNLNDDDWLWGGKIEDIYTTIQHGIRAQGDETRFSEMPAFAEMLDRQTVNAIADFVVATAKGTEPKPQGATAYANNCAVCHGETLEGMQELGAPDLADALWLYSASKDEIAAQIRKPKHGMMPAWEGRLDNSTIRQLALYVHALGGGED